MLHIGIFLGILRMTICAEGGIFFGRKMFYRTISGISFLCAIFMGAVFAKFRWADGHAWDDATRARLAAESVELYDNIHSAMALDFARHCGPAKDLSEFPSEEQVSIATSCAKANTLLFLVWACPFGGCFANLVIGTFTLLAGMSTQDTDVSLDIEIERFIKKFLFILLMVGMGFYGASYFSGVSLRLGSVFSAFLFTFLLLLLAWMYMEFGHRQIYSKFKDVEEKMRSRFSFVPYWFKNVAKAMLVWMFNILIPVCYVLDVLRQSVRRAAGKAGPGEGILSPEGQQLANMLFPWSAANTLWWVCALGEAYFTFQFGFSKLTTVFLSWLNTELVAVSFFTVLAIIFVVGAMMFLAPPVPGIAVYLFTGIVVASHANNEQNKDTLGFGMGCGIAIALSFGLKMAACCGQYAMGYFLGKSVRIQALVGVDKVLTRAIMQILEQPGLSMGKVAILVGGPDWPVSVGCGIIRLNIAQMLLGTSPVVVLVGLTVLAGAYLGKVEPGTESTETLVATVLTGVATLAQVSAGLLAMYYIVSVATRDKEKLEKPREEHAVVEQLARDEEAYNRAFKTVTLWSNLRTVHKATIIIAAVCIMVSCPIFAFCETCFQNFCINCSIDKPLEDNGLGGNALNLITYPSGWGTLLIFAVGVVMHLVFIKSCESLAKAELRRAAEGRGKEKLVPEATVVGAEEAPVVGAPA
mmetsp:Transcript_98871/g.268523  ORF Transcript_98871/g.268523 Transcript_98871/m.268523 type:complete len:696 (+) Transcript_98871:1-2088(+)